MPKLNQQDDPIEYLISRRFPLARHFPRSLASRDIDSPMHQLARQQREEAETYRAGLRSLPNDELKKILATEKQKEKDDLVARLAEEESQRFFNLPGAIADFRHYTKLANWTLDEAVALSLGKNPDIVNWKSVSPFVQVSPFAKEYEKRRDIVSRAKWAQQLFEPVYPGIFLSWAKTKLDPLPAELLQAVFDDGISLKGWKDLYQEAVKKTTLDLANQADQNQKFVEDVSSHYKAHLADAYEKLKIAHSELEALKFALQEATTAGQKPLQTRERENLQLMALLGAIRGYGYDPDKSRNTATTAISSDFSDLSLSFSDDRIRDHLKAAFELIPPDWRQRLKSKPYPGKS